MILETISQRIGALGLQAASNVAELVAKVAQANSVEGAL